MNQVQATGCEPEQSQPIQNVLDRTLNRIRESKHALQSLLIRICPQPGQPENPIVPSGCLDDTVNNIDATADEVLYMIRGVEKILFGNLPAQEHNANAVMSNQHRPLPPNAR